MNSTRYKFDRVCMNVRGCVERVMNVTSECTICSSEVLRFFVSSIEGCIRACVYIYVQMSAVGHQRSIWPACDNGHVRLFCCYQKKGCWNLNRFSRSTLCGTWQKNADLQSSEVGFDLDVRVFSSVSRIVVEARQSSSCVALLVVSGHWVGR